MKNAYEKVLREFEELINEDLDPNVATTEEMETAIEILPELVTKLTLAYKVTYR